MPNLCVSAITECQFSTLACSGLTPVPVVVPFENKFVSRFQTDAVLLTQPKMY